MCFKRRDRDHPDQPFSETQDMAQSLQYTITAINTAKELVPISLAKGILGTIASILDIAQSVIKNKSDLEAIIKQCEAVRCVLERATDGATEYNLRGPLSVALSELNGTVNRIASEVASTKRRRFWQRVRSVVIDHEQIVGWENDIERALRLFDTETITGIAIGVERLTSELIGNAASGINVPKYRPTSPPPQPSMFYGRDDLVAELTSLVINDKHLALIGPGGMGKSSIARAILNEPLIMEKFTDRRFFVAYDDLDPSTITFEAFMTRLAGALGMKLAGADPIRQISTFFRSASALVILDNGETFEEASSSAALEKIPSAVAKISEIPGVILILTSRSRRNAPNVRWITKDIPPLELKSAQATFFAIYNRASGIDADGEIIDLLKALEFHPLSINLLANAAQQNDWSPATLLKRWDTQRSKVLDHGKGKLQSLSDTMRLSLDSPSIQDLGEDGRRALAVIAFLPQGLSEHLASELLLSLPQIDSICDVLCRQSLVYRQHNFIKMLAPIQHYIRDSLPPPDTNCMRHIRDLYNRTVEQRPEGQSRHTDIIISDHLNIEHVVAFDLTHVSDGTTGIYDTCWRFLCCLAQHQPRPTILTQLIFNIIENPSTLKPKALCLQHLGFLYDSLSQLTEGARAVQAAEALYLMVGDHENATICVTRRAETYMHRGRFIQSQQVLESFKRSGSWKHLSEAMKAKVWYLLDRARTYKFTVSADELFVTSTEDRKSHLQFQLGHWRAKLYYGGDIVEVKTRLKDLRLQFEDIADRVSTLWALAEAAFHEDKLSEAMEILQSIMELFTEQDPQLVLRLWCTTNIGVVASNQGNHDLAKELIHKASESELLNSRSTHSFLHISYVSACIELNAGQYDMAESRSTATIEGCDMQDDLRYKAFSIRVLGETAFHHGNFTLAAKYFAETRSLCAEMGVPPRHLYSCSPFYTLPRRFQGWALFLDGRSPFANVM